MIARAYELAGDKDQAAAAYGKTFMQGQVDTLASNLASYVDYWVEKKENLQSAVTMAETAARLKPGDPIISGVSLMLIARPARRPKPWRSTGRPGSKKKARSVCPGYQELRDLLAAAGE